MEKQILIIFFSIFMTDVMEFFYIFDDESGEEIFNSYLTLKDECG